jgi:hypothetical protein
LWSQNSSQKNSTRHFTVGVSGQVPGLCGNRKYSLLEFNVFFAIQNAAHELGHM